MLRLNKMKPHGRSTRINSRSAASSSSPETPVMNARLFMGPISSPEAQGSRKQPLIPLDDALSAGGFQAAAELRRLVRRTERTDHGAVIDALLPELGALDLRRARAEHAGELALQGPIGRLRVSLVLLGRDLHQISPAGAGGGCRIGGRDPGRSRIGLL